MLKRLAAIAFIFACTSVAWLVLGGTIMARTNSSGERLRDKVQSIWGAPQVQTALTAEYDATVLSADSAQARTLTRSLRPFSSKIGVELRSEPRQKGLLWYSTYKVGFDGNYEFVNPEPERKTMRVYLRFPLPRPYMTTCSSSSTARRLRHFQKRKGPG